MEVVSPHQPGLSTWSHMTLGQIQEEGREWPGECTSSPIHTTSAPQTAGDTQTQDTQTGH